MYQLLVRLIYLFVVIYLCKYSNSAHKTEKQAYATRLYQRSKQHQQNLESAGEWQIFDLGILEVSFCSLYFQAFISENRLIYRNLPFIRYRSKALNRLNQLRQVYSICTYQALQFNLHVPLSHFPQIPFLYLPAPDVGYWHSTRSLLVPLTPC